MAEMFTHEVSRNTNLIRSPDVRDHLHILAIDSFLCRLKVFLRWFQFLSNTVRQNPSGEQLYHETILGPSFSAPCMRETP